MRIIHYISLMVLLLPYLALTQLCSKPADIVFAIDVSFSIGTNNFNNYVLPFVRDVVIGFDIGPGTHQVRVGAVTFSYDAEPAFLLGTFTTKPDLLRAITEIKYSGGETYTSKALQFVRESMFGEKHGGRAEADRVMIVLTDGRSHNTTKTLLESEKCRQTGLTIFAVGVGSADERELKGMVNSPPEKFMFYVSNFQALESIRQSLTENTCSSLNQAYHDEGNRNYVEPCSNICTGNASDIVMIIDESFSIGDRVFYSDVLPFLQDVVSRLDIGPDNHQTRVGAIAFGTFARILFRPNRYTDKARLLSAISNVDYQGGGTNTNLALKLAKEQLFKKTSQDVRSGASKVIVLLTDGKADNRQAAVKQADAAKQSGIEIYTIGVGEADKRELANIASKPTRDHVLYSSSFEDLSSVVNSLSRKLNVCY